MIYDMKYIFLTCAPPILFKTQVVMNSFITMHLSCKRHESAQAADAPNKSLHLFLVCTIFATAKALVS